MDIKINFGLFLIFMVINLSKISLVRGSVVSSGSNYCMSYQPFCECKSIEKIECRNLRDLNRLTHFRRTRSDIPNYKRIEYLRLEAASGGDVTLSSALQIDGLVFEPARFQFILSNFAAIELEAGLFSRSQLASGHLHRLWLSNLTLKFLYRGKSEFDWICDLVIGDGHLKPLFSAFK